MATSRNADLDAITKAFSRIPKEARKPIKKSIDKGADELVARMRYLAPEKTGGLKHDIKKVELNELATRVEVDDPVALYQEYGTATNDQHPFFWPSVNTLKKRVRGRVDRAISKAVKTAWG